MSSMPQTHRLGIFRLQMSRKCFTYTYDLACKRATLSVLDVKHRVINRQYIIFREPGEFVRLHANRVEHYADT